LYDENISNRKFEIKVGDLENVSISENSLKQAGINTAPESIKSLIHLSEEIAKFRSVRNLNENAQIEQYKLDKILKDLDADVLYDAIINDKIDNIRAKMMLKSI
jgi:predicted transcriptional regulator